MAMDSRTFIIRKTLVLFLGQVICVAAMCGVFALAGAMDRRVLLGGIVGGVVGVANFFFMAVAADHAADRASEQNVKAGQGVIRTSYLLRLVVMFGVLFVFAKSGLCNVLALVLPVAFVRPIIMITEFFRKSGDSVS